MNSAGAVPNQERWIQLVDRIAELENTRPSELPPVYDVIDPDYLNSLLESEGVSVEFSYFGYEITLTSEGVQSINREGQT